MFEVGSYIIYGSNGVCKVEEIGSVSISGIPKDKLFYTLVPIYSKGSKLFSPIDNNKVIMRAVTSKEDAYKIIDDFLTIETIPESNEKNKEEVYKRSLRKCDCREYVKIIKTIYLRNQSRISEGKKTIAIEEKYLHMAEEHLYGELAISLDMNKSKVEEFIVERVNHLNNV